MPDLNQIELNPQIARNEARAFHAKHAIVTESWSPLGHGARLFALEPVAKAAGAHGRSPAQIVLRWHVQNGLVAVPKSSNPDRLAENLAVFDFELTADEIAALDALDLGESAARDSDVFGH